MSEIFNNLLNDEDFQEQLKQMPEEEREKILKSLRELVENFENLILGPLEKLKDR